MRIVLAPFALLAVVAPALAETAPSRPLTFERDGVRYVAAVRAVGDTLFISGHDDKGASFDLRADKGRVSGIYGATPVNYPVTR